MTIVNPTFKEEKALFEAGFKLIAGVDEAGTGAWAGPVYAGAVILPVDSRIGLLRDSKLLSPGQRDLLFEEINQKALVWAVGSVAIEEINAINNIRQTGLLAMRRAIEALKIKPDFILTDAFKIPNLNLPQKNIIKGDLLVKSIAAASIMAKCSRDRCMEELDVEFPAYGFGQHKGYGTKIHQEALLKFGLTSHHRVNYEPIKNLKTFSKIPAWFCAWKCWADLVPAEIRDCLILLELRMVWMASARSRTLYGSIM